LIHVQCEKCGQKIKAPDEYAGKRIKCPKCKDAFVLQNQESSIADIESNPVSIIENAPPIELQKVERSEQHLIPSVLKENLINESKTTEEPYHSPFDESTVRKLPAIIDVFLYPLSLSGLLNIFIFWIGVVFLCLSRFFLIGIFGFIGRFIVFAYIYYYLIECIRDSATGGIRAPDNLRSMPDSMEEAKSQVLELISSFIIFWGPALGYLIYQLFSKHYPFDVIFMGLLAYGILFFPMGLLAIVVFDSSSGYNPYIWISSIFRTFPQYILLLGILFFFLCLNYLITRNLFFIVAIPIQLYLNMIAAHILGRFYYLNSNRLDWGL
jgi:phage FluMu protein Com